MVTDGELLAWPEVGRWTLRKRRALDDWLDGEVARSRGRIQGRAMARGRQRPQNDTGCCTASERAVPDVRPLPGKPGRGSAGRSVAADNDLRVAACCLSEGLPLVTRNVKDFVAVAEHHGLALITD